MPIIFDEPTLTLDEKIRVMQDFTATYRHYEQASAALREAHCLRIQFPAVMGPIRDGDLFAGRLGGLPIGFNPQAECQQLGYYLDETEMTRLMYHAESEFQHQALKELRDFWREHITIRRIKDAYDEALLEAVPDKFYVYDRAPAYALYRISGTHLDFGKLLANGVCGLKHQLECMRQQHPGSADFAQAGMIVLDVYTNTCLHYRHEALRMAEAAAPQRKAALLRMAASLERIAQQPAVSFFDAMQMTLMYWLLSGSFNFGRMDDYLSAYYVRDIDSGSITEDEALEMLVGMWRAMSWRKKPYDTRVVIGGEGRQDPNAADRFCRLAIRATMITRDVTPQLTLRFDKSTPADIMQLAWESIGMGTTFPMLYPDDVNIPATMQAFGVPRDQAAQYCPYGCGEYVLFHRSLGTPSGLINLLKVLELTLNNGYDLHTNEPQGLPTGYLWDDLDFESLWARYTRQVDALMLQLARQEEIEYQLAGENCAFLYFSLLFDDCIVRGKPLLSGGIQHLGGTVESYGNINTADSLTAIREWVFEKKTIDPHELLHALESNFEGYEQLRAQLLSSPKFGNDNDAADTMACRVHEQVCLSAIQAGAQTGLDSYLVVIINNNANTVLGKHTAASADGRRAHTFMANANSPFRGADRQGLTAVLNSMAKLRPDIHAGCVQNLKLSKDLFCKDLQLPAALVQGFFDQGGCQAMVSVVGRDDLLNAMKQPGHYRNLIVRVGGFSARFVELNRHEQQEILMRTLY